jgi:mycothiol synthase
MSDSPQSVPDWVVSLATKARTADDAPPFSDQALVDYRLGRRELVAIGENAAALVSITDTAIGREAEFVVDPDTRGHGIGRAMLERLLDSGVVLVWAHGDHPAARALASSHHLTAARELLHLVGEVSATPGSAAATRTGTNDRLGMFVVGQDEDEWVALNAWTFAFHAEQGSVTRADLEQLESEPWFSADNFLVLRRGARMIGYCWLKVERDAAGGGARGEFYVVGVSPDAQGEHLGATLFDVGLARLADLGIHSAHLYVEADNAPALHLYRSRGFTQDSIDIQYSV